MTVKLLAFLDTSLQSGPGRTAEQAWKDLLWAPPTSEMYPPLNYPGRLGLYDLASAAGAATVLAEAQAVGLRGFVVDVGPGAPTVPAALRDGLSDGFGLAFQWRNGATAPSDAELDALVAPLAEPHAILADGRPVLIVRTPDALADLAGSVERLQAAARRGGLPGLYLIANRAEDHGRYTGIGFDALVDPDPAEWRSARRASVPNGYDLLEVLAGHENASNFCDHRFDFAQMMASRMVDRALRGKVLPRVFYRYSDWPFDPPDGATILRGETRSVSIVAEKFVEKAIGWVESRFPETEQLVFVDSWNDYRHGTAIEPSTQLGDVYLRATRHGIDRGRYAAQVWSELPGTLHDEARFEAVKAMGRIVREQLAGAGTSVPEQAG